MTDNIEVIDLGDAMDVTKQASPDPIFFDSVFQMGSLPG